jgi:hypothetical protein
MSAASGHERMLVLKGRYRLSSADRRQGTRCGFAAARGSAASRRPSSAEQASGAFGQKGDVHATLATSGKVITGGGHFSVGPCGQKPQAARVCP